jgi:hypothetical protein
MLEVHGFLEIKRGPLPSTSVTVLPPRIVPEAGPSPFTTAEWKTIDVMDAAAGGGQTFPGNVTRMALLFGSATTSIGAAGANQAAATARSTT